jgi:hypothetical protein
MKCESVCVCKCFKVNNCFGILMKKEEMGQFSYVYNYNNSKVNDPLYFNKGV